MDITEGTLVLSSNRGRYAIDDPTYGPDLSARLCILVCIGNQWVPGRVEYNHDPIYATLGPQTLGEVAQMATKPKAIGGYYVELDGGEIVGLCVGMRVRIL